MASIYKRKDKTGKAIGWRAVVRMKSYPTVCKQCARQKMKRLPKHYRSSADCESNE